ncbi:MAG: hypothetical protein U0174_00240 [Polyangiaceae bacterium]
MSSFSLPFVAFVALVTASACSATGGTGFDDDDAGKKDSGTGISIGGGSDGGTEAGGPATETVLYANTDTELFSLNPSAPNVAPKSLGKFDCIGQGGAVAMTDIGVAKDGTIYGISQVAAYPLKPSADGKTVHCEETWPLPANSRFYGLTMAPVNTVNAEETLIAANEAGELYSIDAQSGKTTKVGNLGKDNQNNPFNLSGDIVFLANGGNPVGFATVRACPKNKCQEFDTLIELNVSAIKPGASSVLKSIRGVLNLATSCKKSGIPTQFGSVYGVAAYGDKVYGFTRDGYSIEISNQNGDTCMLGSSTTMKFAGAGVTTMATVVAPK